MLDLERKVRLMEPGFPIWVNLVFIVTMILLTGCSQKPKCTPAGWCPEGIRPGIEKESFIYSVDKVSKEIENHHTVREAVDTVPRKAILYSVCSTNEDTVLYPCSLAPASLARILEKMNYKDTLKALKIRVNYLVYSSRRFVYEGYVVPSFSPLYSDDDRSYESICSSSDGKDCDFLYANISVYKKMYPDRDWVQQRGFIPIEMSALADSVTIDSLINTSLESKFVHSIQKEGKTSIPFEMCYKDGLATPCDVDSEIVDSIKKIVERQGDTLWAYTYQPYSQTVMEFFWGAVSNQHRCLSSDGTKCDELYALVSWSSKKRKPGTSAEGTYHFFLDDFYYEEYHKIVSDVNMHDGLSIYRKDGTFVRNVP